jgi:hypothetical protein
VECLQVFMTAAQRYEDLDCWKLAMELADLFDAMNFRRRGVTGTRADCRIARSA